jgi:alanine racemase
VIGTLRVSSEALVHNARALRSLVAPAKTAFVVKANGYGHGIAQVAKVIEPLADRICVYSLDEAAVLRDAGISRPILVMGPVESSTLDEALARHLEIALWDTRTYLRRVARAAVKRCARFPVHVKVDTGVARLGLRVVDAAAAIDDYSGYPELQIAGLFSHLAAAEELDSPFTLGQMHAFERIVQSAQPALRAKEATPILHIAASAAAMLWPQMRMDMVRIGIALYGLWPSEQTRAAMNGAAIDLRPALDFRSHLVAVRELDAGTPVGYGASYHTPKPTRIGVVPLGYADGIPRLLSNRGAFLVDGARCPIAGRVCMNMTMIDLSAVPNANPGDRVTLIGTDGDETVGAGDWARWAETINYEIVARLPSTLTRAYG